MLFLSQRPQKLRAHRGRSCERYNQRNHNRGTQRHSKLTKEPADDSSHHEDGDEYGYERRAHRKNGEANLARPTKCRLHRAHSLLQITRDVFQNDDGVVNYKSSRNGQRHQRKIVQAISQQVHDPESSDQRKGDCDTGNQGRAECSQEGEHYQDDQNDRDEQREFNVCDRRPDRHRAVDHHIHINGG